MGRAKSLMMEMEDAQWEDADVSFCCPICECDVEGSTSLPVVYEYGVEEHLPIEVLCFGCSTRFRGWVRENWDICEIELDDYPEVEVKAIPVRGSSHDFDNDDHDYFEWLEQQELASRPVLSTLSSTIDDVKELSLGVLSDQKSQMLARMLLSQSITALEVFLADTLVFAVLSRRDVQERLLNSRTLEIGNKQFKLSDAIGVENFAKEKLLEYLHSVSFHNLGRASALFKVGVGIDIAPESGDLETIQKAIKMRHDCVHRNGKDRLTGDIHSIDKTLILRLAEALLRTAKIIDEKIKNFEAKD